MSERELERAELAAWANDLATSSHDFGQAIEELVNAGCDLAKLAWLAGILSSSSRWTSISKEDAKRVFTDLIGAAEAVDRLFFSQIGQAVA